MKYLFDELGNIIGHEFSETELALIEKQPSVATALLQSYIDVQKEYTERLRIASEERKHYSDMTRNNCVMKPITVN